MVLNDVLQGNYCVELNSPGNNFIWKIKFPRFAMKFLKNI